jgi:hypothetical protein
MLSSELRRDVHYAIRARRQHDVRPPDRCLEHVCHAAQVTRLGEGQRPHGWLCDRCVAERWR